MDVNKTGIDEFTDSFSQDEIISEYKKLLEKYRQLKSAHDEDQQKIYELKRSWETASAAESYLSQELELVTASQTSEIEKVQQKFQSEVDDLKKKYSEATSDVAYWEQKFDECREENEDLRRKVEDLENAEPKELPNVSNGSMERELQLAKENLELLAKVDEYRSKVTSSMMVIAERDRQIEIMKEQLECLEENLQAKREELEEKTQLLESSQERVMELSSELAMLKSTPEDTNRKGNSLFAEVDDQRQQMKRVLAAQKKHYLQMKKCYNESEQEIRRLKRENAAMHKEMQVCATIFLSADKRYKEKLNERILQLLKQNEGLEKKLMWTQEKLIALSLDKGINWLDSMLAFCKTETEELKEQLRSIRIQKGIVEENLQNSQQELAKWRFEALKSRCIIINRETLLEEHKIDFKPIIFTISEKQLEIAQPQIFSRNEACANISPTSSTTTDDKLSNSCINTGENKAPNNSEVIKFESPDASEDVVETIPQKSSPIIKTERPTSNENSTVTGFNSTPTTSRKFEHTQTNLPSNISLCSISSPPSIQVQSPEHVPESKLPGVKFATNKDNVTKLNSFAKTPFKKKFEIYSEESESSKESNSFEIYEDTVCKMPVIKCKDLNSLREKPKDDSIIFCDTIKSDFEIYEDTVCRLPVVKINTCNDETKENEGSQIILKEKSDCQMSSANHLVSILTEHNEKSSTPTSILVKNRNILDDLNEVKTVTFSPELTTEIQIDSEAECKAPIKPRTKSQVVVKRIVVKSNFNKKE